MATTKSNNVKTPELKCSNIDANRVARWVKGGNAAYVRALSLSSFTILKNLDDLRLLLNKGLGLRLSAVALTRKGLVEKNVKQFCGELLDRCTRNAWKTAIRRNSLNCRVTVASSLFSFRKTIPSQEPDVNPYVAKMVFESSPELDPKFAIYASRYIAKEFPQGWDKAYWSNVRSFTPPNKSNLDKKTNGTYRQQAVRGVLPRNRFYAWAGGRVVTPLNNGVRAHAVESGGKWRIITLSEPELMNLRPVNKAMYSFLTKKNWLLRGEAKPECFKSFGRREGEVFISGDYESATDNLNVRLTELVLRRMFDTATHIPTRVREECLRSLRASFYNEAGTLMGTQSRGQLMGNPISFPLLCIINHLTFSFAIKRPDVPVKVNGDDIVFRSSPTEAAAWFEAVEASGLVVSKGKTLQSKSFFSLNSSYFRALNSGVAVIPHFRALCQFKKCDDMGALTGRIAQVKRDLCKGDLRQMALVRVVLRNMHVIYPGQGSFRRRYDCDLHHRVLKATGLLERESFYLTLPEEAAPISKYCKFRQAVIPEGWKKEKMGLNAGAPLPDSLVMETMGDRSWTAPVEKESRDEWWKRARRESYRFVPFRKTTYRMLGRWLEKRARVFAESKHTAGPKEFHYLRPFKPTLPLTKKEEKFWVSNQDREGPRTGPVAFVPGGRVEGTL